MRTSFRLLASLSIALAACSSSSDNTNGNGNGNGNNPGGSDAGNGTGGGNDAGGGGGGNDAGTDTGAPFAEAPHADLPQLVDQGGPVLTAPSVVTITFPGDANAAQLEAFGKDFTTTPYWDTIRQGYCETGSTTTCVGKGATGSSVQLTAAPGKSYTDSSQGGASTLKTYITSLLKNGSITAPTDSNTMLMFYFPSTTTITLDGATSCQQFGGYHQELTYNNVQFTYAIVPECGPQQGSTLSAFQTTTLAASHEIMEAATDPFVSQNGNTLVSGYYLDFKDPASIAWNSLGGGEAGDMCVDMLGLDQDVWTENSFTVQRMWNNDAAKSGHDPCVPALTGTPYFNIAPAATAKIVKVDVGKTVTFEADAFSDAPMADFSVKAIDLGALLEGATAGKYLTFTMNGQPMATVNNGSKVQVSVTLNSDPAASQTGGLGLLLAADAPKNPTKGHYWPILVVTPAEAADAGLISPMQAFARAMSPRRSSLSRIRSLWQ